MTEAKHTPGPWAFSRFEQFGDSRFYVAQADGAPYTPHYSDVATLVAETVSLERLSIQEANAHLIAAAPELLEALQELADCGAEAWGEERPCVRIARAAIAKATGN